MTPLQRQYARVVIEYLSAMRLPASDGQRPLNPSYRQIMADTGIPSLYSVRLALTHLEDMGYITRRGNSARSVRVLVPFAVAQVRSARGGYVAAD